MHHPSLTIPSTDFSGHVNETLHFSRQIPIYMIPSILPPLTAKNTTLRRLSRHGRDWSSDQGEPLCFIEPGPSTATGGKQLVQHRGVNDADDGLVIDDERDGDAEHGEEVRVVHRAVQRVDAPCWRVGDEIVLRGIFAV